MKLIAPFAALGMFVVAGIAAGATPEGDVNRGRTIFARCAACHTATTATNRVGPSLKGIAGRRIASVPDFNYSPAFKGMSVTWTRANLDAFLAAPARFAPGTRMPLGVANPQERADVVAYLSTLR